MTRFRRGLPVGAVHAAPLLPPLPLVAAMQPAVTQGQSMQVRKLELVQLENLCSCRLADVWQEAWAGWRSGPSSCCCKTNSHSQDLMITDVVYRPSTAWLPVSCKCNSMIVSLQAACRQGAGSALGCRLRAPAAVPSLARRGGLYNSPTRPTYLMPRF